MSLKVALQMDPIEDVSIHADSTFRIGLQETVDLVASVRHKLSQDAPTWSSSRSPTASTSARPAT